MTNLPEPSENTAKTNPRPTTGVPGWLIVLVIIALALVMVVVSLHLMGVDFAGGHGL